MVMHTQTQEMENPDILCRGLVYQRMQRDCHQLLGIRVNIILLPRQITLLATSDFLAQHHSHISIPLTKLTFTYV